MPINVRTIAQARIPDHFERRGGGRGRAASLLLALVVFAGCAAGCRGEAEQARGGGASADPAPTSAGDPGALAAAGDGAASESAQPRPREGRIDVREAGAAPALPEPERLPAGLVALPRPAGSGAWLALVDEGTLRSWRVDAAGEVAEQPAVSLHVAEGDALVEAYTCGAVPWRDGLGAVVLRRSAGSALEPALVTASGGAEALALPAGWRVADAGARPCAVLEQSADAFVLALVRADGAPGLARYATGEGGLEVSAVVVPDTALEPGLEVDLEPAFGVARGAGETVLLGFRARRTNDRTYAYALLELDTRGTVLRGALVAEHARRPVLGVPAVRAGEAGAWVASFDDATALEVAYEEAQLGWRALGGEAPEAVASLPGVAWQAPMEAVESGGESWLLLVPPLPSRPSARLAALVSPSRPDEVLALVEAPVLEARAVPWDDGVLVVALSGASGDETRGSSARLELRWFWP